MLKKERKIKSQMGILKWNNTVHYCKIPVTYYSAAMTTWVFLILQTGSTEQEHRCYIFSWNIEGFFPMAFSNTKRSIMKKERDVQANTKYCRLSSLISNNPGLTHLNYFPTSHLDATVNTNLNITLSLFKLGDHKISAYILPLLSMANFIHWKLKEEL